MITPGSARFVDALGLVTSARAHLETASAAAETLQPVVDTRTGMQRMFTSAPRQPSREQLLESARTAHMAVGIGVEHLRQAEQLLNPAPASAQSALLNLRQAAELLTKGSYRDSGVPTWQFTWAAGRIPNGTFEPQPHHWNHALVEALDHVSTADEELAASPLIQQQAYEIQQAVTSLARRDLTLPTDSLRQNVADDIAARAFSQIAGRGAQRELT